MERSSRTSGARQTDKRTEMVTDSVRLASLADAIPAPKQVSGKTRMTLQNPHTGEWFYSFCSAHWDHNPDCKTCWKGMWGY